MTPAAAFSSAADTVPPLGLDILPEQSPGAGRTLCQMSVSCQCCIEDFAQFKFLSDSLKISYAEEERSARV